MKKSQKLKKKFKAAYSRCASSESFKYVYKHKCAPSSTTTKARSNIKLKKLHKNSYSMLVSPCVRNTQPKVNNAFIRFSKSPIKNAFTERNTRKGSKLLNQIEEKEPLVLPDESNYNRMVSFVADLKNSLEPSLAFKRKHRSMKSFQGIPQNNNAQNYTTSRKIGSGIANAPRKNITDNVAYNPCMKVENLQKKIRSMLLRKCLEGKHEGPKENVSVFCPRQPPKNEKPSHSNLRSGRQYYELNKKRKEEQAKTERETDFNKIFNLKKGETIALIPEMKIPLQFFLSKLAVKDVLYNDHLDIPLCYFSFLK